jgi:hypothetical protein
MTKFAAQLDLRTAQVSPGAANLFTVQVNGNEGTHGKA